MTQLGERIVEIRVGPSGSPGRSWKNPAYIEFEIERTAGRSPNKATARIYNLSDQSRQWLEQSDQQLQILAGERIPGQLFFGDIARRGVTTKIQNENTIHEIKAADGRRRWRDSIFSKAYPPNIARSTILRDVLAASGLPSGYIAELPPRQYPNGYAITEWVRDVLDDLLIPDAEWSIQDGAIQITLIGQKLPGNTVVIKASTGMIGSPERTDKGINVKTILTREIIPSKGVRVESRVFTGDLRVTKVNHRGNSEGQQWETQVVGVPIS